LLKSYVSDTELFVKWKSVTCVSITVARIKRGLEGFLGVTCFCFIVLLGTEPKASCM
jgi:hypothetical protein